MADIHGFVFDVSEERQGDEVAVAAAAGATSVTVVNVIDFDVNRWVQLPDGQVAQVTAVTMNDDRSGVLALADPTDSALEPGDRVNVWSESAQTVVSEWVASVRDSSDGSVVQAPIAHALISNLPDGAAGVQNSSVVVSEDDQRRRTVSDVIGKRPRYAGTAIGSFVSPSGLSPRVEQSPAGYEVTDDGVEVTVDLHGPEINPGGTQPRVTLINGPDGSTADIFADRVSLGIFVDVVEMGDGDVGSGTFRDSVVAEARTAATDVEVTDATKGVILRSPNGTRWRVKVTDAGALTVTAI